MPGMKGAASATLRRARLDSVDAVRGVVMIVMALDHVRDFVHRGAMSQSPTDLATTTPLLFLTRWITHFCAPVFMFTAGIGAYFYLVRRSPGEAGWQPGRSRGQLSTFLLTRGLWLMLLEVTVMRVAYNFDVGQSYPFFLLVLWGLGLSMIVLAALVWLPIPLLSVLSVATIVLHNVADGIRAQQFGAAAPLWNLIHQVGAFQFAGHVFITPYPLVPWIAVMALGFCFGPVLQLPPARRQRLLIRVGISTIIAFILVRAFNVYGDPSRWAWQATASYTVLSFLNTTKYPPSLSFLLMTIGPALVMLAAFDRRTFANANPLIVFGRVPLFYFVLHFIAAHVASLALALATYGTAALTFVWQPVPSMGGPASSFPPNFGWDLSVVYAVGITMVVALYPLCRWFAARKSQDRAWWLSYL
jgi:uncharacterized membrane protein